MSIENRLLSRLDDQDFKAIFPLLKKVDLALKTVVLERDQKIEFVYFPENCTCSILALTDCVEPIEVGMVGYEGMTDMTVVAGDISRMRTIVQGPGTAWRMKAEDCVQALRDRPSFNETVMRFKEVVAIMFAYTALAHGSFTIEERLARWLLMSHDRVRRDQIPMIHEFLAAMLAVRRSGVTTAMHVLEGQGAIKATRGMITVRDRAKLLELSGGSYGVPEAEYERLMRKAA